MANRQKLAVMTCVLQVTFNGNNGDAVFGDYRCEAVNLRGSSEITLSMRKASK